VVSGLPMSSGAVVGARTEYLLLEGVVELVHDLGVVVERLRVRGCLWRAVARRTCLPLELRRALASSVDVVAAGALDWQRWTMLALCLVVQGEDSQTFLLPQLEEVLWKQA
jgi:hypothetical protein